MKKYRANMIQSASCVVEFEAPEDATQEELIEAAYNAEFPSLCHQCADTNNMSLNIDGEWNVDVYEGKPLIHVEDEKDF